MPLTEQEAFDAALEFIRKIRRKLPYAVIEEPAKRSRRTGYPPSYEGEPIGADYWEFYFLYNVPGKLVDPSCANVFVDSDTGATALAVIR